jgi:phosphoglycerate dehydrogenase-like enzyme
MRVAILDDFHSVWASSAGVQRLRQRADVHIFTAPFGAASSLRGFTALIANRERTRFTRDLLHQLSDVRIIVQTGNHAAHVDFVAAAELGIIVAKASAGYSIGTAELAIGLAIAVMRQIPANEAAVRRGEWSPPSTPVMHGKTIGIIGLGEIGRHVAGLANAFGMRVLGWSPQLTDSAAAAVGAERRELDDLLAHSDVVSIHAALTPSSRGLLDGRRLGLMKRTAFLVNTARGAIVDEQALICALTQRRIAGAALDVFDNEPLPEGHAFTMLPNVVLQPHIGWQTDDGYQQFIEASTSVLLKYMDGLEVPRFYR